MAFVTGSDGVELYVEATGSGEPILFIHEFAGDHRSWEPQVRWFSRRYRCITYCARGYPPSDVPADVTSYSQAQAVEDARSVLDGMSIDRAHVIGNSMGAFCGLHLALRHPDRTRSVVVAACGYGTHPDARESFRREAEAVASALEHEDMAAVASRYAVGPARVQLQNKDPRGWAEFAEQLAEHSPVGAALTMRGVQRERPSLYDLGAELERMTVPMLLIVGDEDEGALDASLMLKRTVPSAGLAVLPRTGHTANLEEPSQFNQLVGDFLSRAEHDRWDRRDPRSLAGGTTGIEPISAPGSTTSTS
ncbi:MAG: alpha/beta fold hydrolase [Acidimicrobiales bacterium]